MNAGILILNKSRGLTSRDAVNRVQKIVRPTKVGHAGTLDPLASGVLVLCLGKATRLISYIQDRPKTYLAAFELGTTSETCDAEGELTPTGNLQTLTAADVEQVLPQFEGNILQRPPRFSAVHVNGQRAYELARQNLDFELKAKPVHISSLEITDWSFPRFSLKIVCGSGTYIRSLARDIGDTIGCGAYMADLVRTAIGEFNLDRALDPADLTREHITKHLIDAGDAVKHLPRVICMESDVSLILHGRQFEAQKPRQTSAGSQDSQLTAVYDANQRLICLAEPVPETNSFQPRQVFVEHH